MPTDADLNEFKRSLSTLHEKVTLKDSEVSALMSVVIQTNKEVSNNLVKLTEVVSNVTTLEKVQEEQQESINKLAEKVSKNETDIKLTLQDKQHIKESLEEIKDGQRAVLAWAGKVFGTIVTVAIIGGLVYAQTK